MMSDKVQLVDCPRDAIQGIHSFIPTGKKVAYLQRLIDSGLFDFLDFGSFVSAGAVPQMADSEDVVRAIGGKSATKLIAIIANERGAHTGKKYSAIDYLGYPFSMSETFQRRNTNRSIDEAFDTVKRCQEILDGGPALMIYVSMAFGNPYGDTWDPDIVLGWMEKLSNVGIGKFSIADTTAEASPEQIEQLFGQVRMEFPDAELSIHLHSRPANALSKVEAAYKAGCRIFEGAIMGYGGCPFAQDDLVGNIPSELLINRFGRSGHIAIDLLMDEFQQMLRHEL
ncbi:hydroxymethylglutaryl-CoA lyase [Sphingobacterium allocomposti]|nr:hydroxymethylglutaryl-CoA lyase [Sphingobacterium composti Yoo et al. 2007 non Ten et al. 2007]